MALSNEGRLVVDDVLHSVPSFGPPYLAIVPNVCAILWNSLLHISESSKLPLTVMILLGPGILSTKYGVVRHCHETRKRGSFEDRMILRGPVHDFKL
jgi:hypothetical protein